MNKNFDIVDKGASRYVSGDVKPFDQKNDVLVKYQMDIHHMTIFDYQA